jgi:hypothetical protein
MDYAKENWELKYGLNMPSKPKTNGSGWFINMPKTGAVVSYAMTEDKYELFKKKKVPNNSSVTMTVTIEASPDAYFEYKTQPDNLGNAPATARVMLYSSLYGEFNRWFGIQGIEMVEGTHTIKIPLEPDKWLSVFGKKGDFNANTRKKFKEFLIKPLNVGVVFGGGSFYGHGLFMSSGSATFRLRELTI